MLLAFTVRVYREEINSSNAHPDFLQIVPGINFGTKELQYYMYAFCNAPFRKDNFIHRISLYFALGNRTFPRARSPE